MNIATIHSLPGNGNSGIVPPWLLPTPVVPLPGPADDEFRILPIDDEFRILPIDLPVVAGVSLLT